MTILTPAAVLSIAMQCLPPALAPVAAGIAQHENPRLDTETINHNGNGTSDYGLAQINTVNLGWLGLTPRTVLEPCANLKAAVAVLFARYNGNGTSHQKATYAAGAIARIGQLPAAPLSQLPPISSQPARSAASLEDRPAGLGIFAAKEPQ